MIEELREGGTNAEIATRLGVSPDAVKYHISNMLGTLDLQHRPAGRDARAHARADCHARDALAHTEPDPRAKSDTHTDGDGDGDGDGHADARAERPGRALRPLRPHR